jgi:hypothetical protein
MQGTAIMTKFEHNYIFKHTSPSKTLPVYLKIRPLPDGRQQAQHITQLTPYTAPFHHRTAQRRYMARPDNVLVATDNSLVAEAWGANYAMDFDSAHHLASLMGLDMVVISNAYCSLETESTVYTLCYKRRAERQRLF